MRLRVRRSPNKFWPKIWMGLVALWVWAMPALASAAAYGVVTVDLKPEAAQAGQVPTQLCVVSEVKGPRTRNTLEELLVKHEGAGEGLYRLREGALGVEDRQASCAADGACAALVQLPPGAADPKELYAACTTDALAGEAEEQEARVLFLMLEHLEGSPPSIEAVNLAGGVATVGVEANLAKIIVTTRSLGGHFVAHRRAYRAETTGGDSKLAQVPVAPRCAWVDAELPGARLKADDRGRVELWSNAQSYAPEDPAACIQRPAADRLRVYVPRARPGEGSLRVALPGQDDTQRPAVDRWQGEWAGSWPAGRVHMEPQRISFRWRRPACVYSESACPTAVLEGGIECSVVSEPGELCEYVCPGEGEGDSEIQTPVTVSFEKDGPRQRWSEILQRPGQEIAGYVGADETYLLAEVGDWKKKTPGDRLTHLEVLGADGSMRRYGLRGAETLQVLVPGASCAPVRYRLVGDRHHEEDTAAVKDGKIVFDHPERSGRLLTFHLLLAQGGGPALTPWSPEDLAEPVYFTGIIQLAANFRPRNPKYSRLAGEIRLGGTVGQWGYYDESTLGDEPRRVGEKIAWARFLFEPAIVVDLFDPVALGLGLGVGSSWPLNIETTFLTDRFFLLFSPSLELRVKLRPWLALDFQGRAVIGERTNYAIPTMGENTELRSTPNVSLLGLYGFLLSF